MNRFRKMLKCYRLEAQLTTAAMAREIGIPRTTLDQFERRNNGTKSRVLAKLLCYALSDETQPRH